MGALWGFATLYNPNWGEIARDNRFVIEMYSKGLHKSVEKHYNAKDLTKQLYAKDIQQKHEIYDEFLRLKHEEEQRQKLNRSKEQNGEQNKEQNLEEMEVEMWATAHVKEVERNKWLAKLLHKDIDSIEISKEIDEMSYEERKLLEQKALGESLAVNYNTWPFKGLTRSSPQFFIMDQEKLRNESDTAKLVNTMHSEKHKKSSPFNEQSNMQKRNNLKILS